MSYYHLTHNERAGLAAYLRLGLSQASAARHLGRDPATISRELRRNGYPTKSGYHIGVAHRLARSRRAQANYRPRIVPGGFLDRYIPRALSCDLSPEQIAGKLAFALGSPQVCHETIYRWIYLKRPDLGKLLPYRCNKYRRRRGTNTRWYKRETAKKRWIDERPTIVDTRGRIGDWEGDTVHGAAKSGYLATLVERKSGYLVARKLQNPNGEEMLGAVMTLASLPPAKRRTLTLDNGFEMNQHEEMERRLGITVYFAHPYHSWERGTNENTNGLLRRYFPKKSSFASLTQERVDWAVRRLNNRPRKRLGYQTPQMVFNGVRCTSD